MLIILSQKIDTESEYSGDKVFKVYHYPGRYRNQIHTGDTFIYYQGNRYDKSQRYYFGMGQIGEIQYEDENNYYAELLSVVKFKRVVPIYLPDGGYIEQLGYESVRKSINPPWQSSIRPLSQAAFEYIMKEAGRPDTIAFCNEKLKTAIRKYYVSDEKKAILQILEQAKQLAEIYGLAED